MNPYDVFISHASEDKVSVAVPLADHLTRAGLKVWLDALELRIGDSLRERIDQGLGQSRFGIVILSPSFFQKEWPKREINALFALEADGARVLLPVWHQVVQQDVRAFSPMLADRLAANTEGGLVAVARAILAVVQKDGITAALSRLIEQGPLPEQIAAFLAMRPEIVPRAIGEYGMFRDNPTLVQNLDLPPFHLMSHTSVGSYAAYCCWYFAFQPSVSTRENDQKLVQTLVSCTDVIEHQLPTDRCPFQSPFLCKAGLHAHLYRAMIYYGRRHTLSAQAQEIMRLHSEQRRIEVHSYDSLLEASASLE